MIPLALALALFHVATAIALRDGWQLAPNVFDGLAVIALIVATLRAPRAGRIVGIVLGTYVIANVGLVAAVGSPLTPALLTYAGDARVVPTEPLVVGLTTLAAWATLVVVTRNVDALTSRGVAYAGAVVVLAVPLSLVRGVWGAHQNPFAALAPSSTSTSGARVPFDAPIEGTIATPSAGRGVRHVVIWLAESVGDRRTSIVEGGPPSTPNLARLRGEGSLTFTNWSANTPVSAKAIFTTLCGLYALPEATFEARAFPRIACPSLMETMGVRSALFHGGYFAFTDKRALLEERGFDVLMDGENVPDRDKWFTNGWGVDDAALVENGLAWLDQASGPTLAVYIPLVPHYEYWLPPDAPTPFGKRTLQDRYENGVAYTDAMFGRLVEGYRARGLMNETLFVFLGDHGEAFEEHPKNKLHAGEIYEENVRVPAVFIAPKLFKGVETSARPASHVDLVPTVLELAGVAARAGVQGQSLVSDAWVNRPVMLSTYYPSTVLGLRANQWKYIRRADGEELYDVVADPREKANVAAQHDLAEYRGRVADWEVRQRALLTAMPTLGAPFLDRALAAMKGDVLPTIVMERSFNMERRCLKVSAPKEGTLVLTTTVPVRVVGIGLTDKARFAKGDPVRARFNGVELEVNDTFETTSKVRTIEASTELRIEIDAAQGKNRDVCITLGP